MAPCSPDLAPAALRKPRNRPRLHRTRRKRRACSGLISKCPEIASSPSVCRMKSTRHFVSPLFREATATCRNWHGLAMHSVASDQLVPHEILGRRVDEHSVRLAALSREVERLLSAPAHKNPSE